MPFIVRRDYVYLRQQHSCQANTVNGGQQYVISQHAKALPSPSSPSIHTATSNPYRIENNQGWMWYRGSHRNATPDRYSPSKQLNRKAKRITTPIILDPF